MKRGYLKRLFSCVLTLCMLIASFAGIVTVSADNGSTENVDPFENSVFENYITRRGSILYDGSEPFRTSVGLAAGNLFCPEDGGYHFADEFEMRDMFETMIQLGQNSTRTGWFSFRPKDGKNHQSVATQELEWMVEGPGQFNEEGFRAMDKMLQLANEYGIRLFIPISPNPEVMSSYRNLTADQFYNNLQLIEDTKAIFNYTLNRTNYYTGVKYKDDPAILAWQIGNELDRSGCTTKWTNLMSEYIKSIDQNHLVAAPQTHYWKDVVSDPNIDIVDTHIYDAMQFKEMIASDIEAIKGQKALVLGELGMQTGEFFADLLPWISEQPEVFGAYLFMMGSHNSLGGIYCHSSYSDYPNLFWPGYDEEPDNGLGGTGTEGLWNTQLLFKTIRELNYGKKGVPVPEISMPKAPHLLPIENADDIWWRGSVGARYYDVERAENENGPWTVVGENIQDYKQPRNKTLTSKDGTLFGALFADKTIQENKTYYYRVKAKTPDGVESDYSNVRKLGDTTLDEILQKEADEKADAKAQPQIKAEIPTVSGELEPFVPNVIKRVNLPTEIKVQLSNAVVLKIGESNAFVNNGVDKIDPEKLYDDTGKLISTSEKIKNEDMPFVLNRMDLYYKKGSGNIYIDNIEINTKSVDDIAIVKKSKVNMDSRENVGYDYVAIDSASELTAGDTYKVYTPSPTGEEAIVVFYKDENITNLDIKEMLGGTVGSQTGFERARYRWSLVSNGDFTVPADAEFDSIKIFNWDYNNGKSQTKTT